MGGVLKDLQFNFGVKEAELKNALGLFFCSSDFLIDCNGIWFKT